MRLLAGFLTLLLLTGCATQPATRPSPDPTPTPAVSAPSQVTTPPPQPAPADPCGGLLKIWDGSPAPGPCNFTVSTGALFLDVTVKAPSEEAAVQAISVKGAELLWLWPPDARDRVAPRETWAVDFSLGAGKAGEKISLTITRAPGEAPVTATLTRAEPPRATILLQGENGSWAPIEAGVSLPPGPKRLRLQTTGGLKVTSLKPTYITSGYAPLTPDRVTQIADDLLEVEFTNPPPLVQVYVGGAEGPNGLRVPTVSGHFYIGEPPAFVALDRATGKAERIGAAPPDLNSFPVLRKDGRYLTFTTLLPESVSGEAVWLLDLKSGGLTRTSFQYEDGDRPGFDIRGRLIAPAGPGRLGVLEPESGRAEIIRAGATFWTEPSPDGRYIAGRIGPPPGRSTGAWIGHPRTHGLVVRDLSNDTEQRFPWTGYGKVIWLPDGRLLKVTAETNTERAPEQAVTVDPVTGAETPYIAPWPRPAAEIIEGKWQPGDRPLAILPDGRVLIYRWPNAAKAKVGMI